MDITLSRPLNRSARLPGGAPSPSTAGSAAVASTVQGTGPLFAGLLVLLLVEYIGLATMIPILRVTRFSTVLAYGLTVAVILKFGVGDLMKYRQSRLLLAFLGMATLSIFYAVVQSYVPTNVRYQAGYVGLFLITVMLVDRQSRINRLAVTGTIIVMALVARNPDNLTAVARIGSFQAPYFMGDGNDFAWGILTLMPFPLFLMLGRHGVIARLFGAMGAMAGLVGIIGTQSRGATLGLVAASLYYWLVLSKRKAAGLVVIAVVALGVVALAPSNYRTRMSGVDLEVDTSAQGRLRAWGAAVQMAVDYPLGVGAGSFNSAYGRFYRPANLTGIESRWISAHSVYFKTLGEYGFLGVLIVLTLLWTNIRDNTASLRHAVRRPEASGVQERWPALLNFGVVGYSVAGAFLGGIEYPHFYILSGLALSCRRLTTEWRGAPAISDAVSAPAPTTPIAGRPITIHPALRPRPVQIREVEAPARSAGARR
jgi:putative inorganic carbon (HCO3(-)) transporter